MSDDLSITNATSDGDLERISNALIVDLRNGRRGVNDPFVYEALFQLKIRRRETQGLPAAEAEAAAREETLNDIQRLAAKQVAQVVRQRRPMPVVNMSQPLSDDAGDEDELSPGDIAELDEDRQLDQADPDQVRLALRVLCDHLRSGTAAPVTLAEFLCRWLCAYLNGEYNTVDEALGLTRKRGRPRAKESRQVDLAAEVWRLRLVGKPHEDAVAQVAEDLGSSASVIGRAFRDYGQLAAAVVDIEYAVSGTGRTAEEKERWTKIFGT